MLEFQQSEQTASHRTWIIVLVDSSDGVTGKTGQTGQAYISKNGATPALSINSIVEVDSSNMPGHYYLVLDQTEVDTLGMVSITMKTASTLAFHDRAIVSYDDPFARHGGFATGGSGKDGGIRKDQVKSLLADIRKVVKEEIQVLEDDEDAEEVEDDQEIAGLDAKLDQILEAVTTEEIKEEIDFSPILDAIATLPVPKDYAKDLAKIAVQINGFGNAHNIDVEGFNKSVKEFQVKMLNGGKAVDEINKVTAVVKNLQSTLDKFQSTLSEQSDMDKRFDAMNSASGNKKIEELTKKLNDFMVKVVDMKYEILKGLIKKSK